MGLVAVPACCGQLCKYQRIPRRRHLRSMAAPLPSRPRPRWAPLWRSQSARRPQHQVSAVVVPAPARAVGLQGRFARSAARGACPQRPQPRGWRSPPQRAAAVGEPAGPRLHRWLPPWLCLLPAIKASQSPLPRSPGSCRPRPRAARRPRARHPPDGRRHARRRRLRTAQYVLIPSQTLCCCVAVLRSTWHAWRSGSRSQWRKFRAPHAVHACDLLEQWAPQRCPTRTRSGPTPQRPHGCAHGVLPSEAWAQATSQRMQQGQGAPKPQMSRRLTHQRCAARRRSGHRPSRCRPLRLVPALSGPFTSMAGASWAT
mmetsp:Transcript_105259/g.293138  ORF Transcript_105259/g.293138 Transcript_105259/m.293138 type:complete len:314 (+) Transcript_105259:222-1163(+)